jgi:hypothetical protein
MTPVVQSLLTTFDRLTDSEHRFSLRDFKANSYDDLMLNAEEIFLQLDEEESASERS